jgi:hypothetical protein
VSPTLAFEQMGLLLYRRLVTAVLDRALSKYYPYAGRDLAAAAALSDRIAGDLT